MDLPDTCPKTMGGSEYPLSLELCLSCAFSIDNLKIIPPPE